MINKLKIQNATARAKSEYDGFSRSTQILVIVGFLGLVLLGIAGNLENDRRSAA